MPNFATGSKARPGSSLTLAAQSASRLTQDNFPVRTPRDLVTFCTTNPASADYGPAISSCHGFAVGAFQYCGLRLSGCSNMSGAEQRTLSGGLGALRAAIGDNLYDLHQESKDAAYQRGVQDRKRS